MASSLSVQDALQVLQKAKADQEAQDARRISVEDDIRAAREMLNERFLKPAEDAAKQAAAEAAEATEEARKEGEKGTAKLNGVLSALRDRASVAVITMLGSLCPVTLGHVQCFIEARRIILNDSERQAPRPARLEHFDECLGLIWLNSDSHVSTKMAEKGHAPICITDRGHLVDLATAGYPWLCHDAGYGMRYLRGRWSRLRFTEFVMNGADDVVKYSKWEYTSPSRRMVAMGRPGFTTAVIAGMKESKIDPDDGNCFLGPELPDISSTEARNASACGDRKTLLTLLHPAVADWLLRRDGHERPPSSSTLEVASGKSLRTSHSSTSLQTSALKSAGASVLKPAAATAKRVTIATPKPAAKAQGVGNAARRLGSRAGTGRSSPGRSPSPVSRNRPKDTLKSQHQQLVETAWSLVIGKSHAPPPLSPQELREQLRIHLVETQADQLPRDSALKAMDELLQHELKQKAITESHGIERIRSDSRLALWQGDITTLKIGGIVNAANEKGLGCFQPDHRCIDNVIHCAAGPALRSACHAELQREPWSGKLPTGEVLVTAAYNLPCEYVLHVPGPRCFFGVEQPEMLMRCYQNVLEECKRNSIRSIAFCCISTGLFGYPAASAAKVAVSAVREWLDKNSEDDGPGPVELVVFNVFSGQDLSIYQKLLD